MNLDKIILFGVLGVVVFLFFKNSRTFERHLSVIQSQLDLHQKMCDTMRADVDRMNARVSSLQSVIEEEANVVIGNSEEVREYIRSANRVFAGEYVEEAEKPSATVPAITQEVFAKIYEETVKDMTQGLMAKTVGDTSPRTPFSSRGVSMESLGAFEKSSPREVKEINGSPTEITLKKKGVLGDVSPKGIIQEDIIDDLTEELIRTSGSSMTESIMTESMMTESMMSESAISESAITSSENEMNENEHSVDIPDNNNNVVDRVSNEENVKVIEYVPKDTMSIEKEHQVDTIILEKLSNPIPEEIKDDPSEDGIDDDDMDSVSTISITVGKAGGSKKKKQRGPPNVQPRNFPLGYEKVSENDGNMYYIGESKTGSKRWIKRV